VPDEDRERFELLYRQHFRRVLRYALARLEPELAKDVAAETFLIAWRRISDVPDQPLAWLLGVARKVVAGQCRAGARRNALGERLATARGRMADQPDPADEVAGREAALTALGRLGETDREILMLVAWDGLSAGEGAEVLGVTRLNFSVRLHRARTRLAAELARSSASDWPGAYAHAPSAITRPVSTAHAREAR
jgi:RNA polymerase sigma-70 factor (ECF subfamily)